MDAAAVKSSMKAILEAGKKAFDPTKPKNTKAIKDCEELIERQASTMLDVTRIQYLTRFQDQNPHPRSRPQRPDEAKRDPTMAAPPAAPEAGASTSRPSRWGPDRIRIRCLGPSFKHGKRV